MPMNTETRENYLPRAVGSFLLPTILVGAGAILSSFAFTKESREIIRRRDGNCQWGEEDLHQGNLHCAHINHDKSYEKYNDPENGRLLCERHHYLDHVNREGRNGLSIEHNKMAKEGLMHSLLKFLGGKRRF